MAILANSKIEDIENLLQNCAPFESAKAGEGECDKLAQERKNLRSFWVTGLKGVTEAEAAKMIVEEAREILQKDLGVEIQTWGQVQNPEIGEFFLTLQNKIILVFGSWSWMNGTFHKNDIISFAVPGFSWGRRHKFPKSSFRFVIKKDEQGK